MRVFLAALAIAALFTRTSATSSHEWSRLGTIDSIVERGTYELETSRFHGTIDKIFANGHFYSHQPPLLPTIEAPVYWVLRRFGLQFWNSAPFDLAYYLFTVATNGVAFALTAVLLHKSFLLLGATSRRSVWLALVLPLGTWLLPYAVVSNNHGIAAMLLALVAYELLAITRRGATAATTAALGTALGLLAVVEIVPLATFVPLTCLFVVGRPEIRRGLMLATFAAGLALPIGGHALLNVPITGDLWPGGFHQEMFDYPGSRFTSETLTGSFNHESIPALGRYAWRGLISEKGYFTFAPVLLAGVLWGVIRWRWWTRAQGAYVVMLVGSLMSLVVALATTSNFGGAAVGFRHAAFVCPVWLLMLAPAVGAARSKAAAALAGIAVVSALGLCRYAVPNPWTDLRLPPQSAAASWRDYVPVVAYALDRSKGRVDEFGNLVD